jgi:hypothetical protein
MPAYSFQERFCPFVIDGTKPHTIRNRRKFRAGIGSTLYLYFGLRTKWCKLLRVEVCTTTFSLSISKKHGIVFYSRILTADELKLAEKYPTHKNLPIRKILDDEAADCFAWMDGFRPNGSNTDGAYELMMRFWQQTHKLPWAGDIVYWHPKQNK